jgi:hypothetical protein
VDLRRRFPQHARRHPHDRELIFLRTGDQPVGAAVVLTSVSYMLLASLAMGIAEAIHGAIREQVTL